MGYRTIYFMTRHILTRMVGKNKNFIACNGETNKGKRFARVKCKAKIREGNPVLSLCNGRGKTKFYCQQCAVNKRMAEKKDWNK